MSEQCDKHLTNKLRESVGRTASSQHLAGFGELGPILHGPSVPHAETGEIEIGRHRSGVDFRHPRRGWTLLEESQEAVNRVPAALSPGLDCAV